MKTNLKNHLGLIKQAPTGFSWTYLFFGSFVPLLRGDLKWFFLTLLMAFFTFGFSQFVMIFMYNKIYINGLIEQGYKPADDYSLSILKSKGIYYGN